MYLAIIEPGSYLDIARSVPFSDADGVVERGVLDQDGRVSRRAQSAVRPISATDFKRILERGLDEGHALLPRLAGDDASSGFSEPQDPCTSELERPRLSSIVSRAVRDRVFRRVVLNAYGERCAITGLKLINGGGRAEVAAAHIRPVEANGPDNVSNGLALSGTARSAPRARRRFVSRPVQDDVGNTAVRIHDLNGRHQVNAARSIFTSLP